MKQNRLIALLSLLLLTVCLRPESVLARQGKQITLEDIWSEQTFEVKSVPGFNALKNGREYTAVIKGKQIDVFDLASGKAVRSLFESPDSMAAVEHYTFSDKEDKILLYTEGESVYRRSRLYRVWIYDIATRSLKLLDKDKVLHARFNPAGDRVAFVKANNLFLYDLKSDLLSAITTDGKKNEVINGNCDWVYEEEFSFTRAFEWSPDGGYLAFYRFDERRVKEYTIPYFEAGQNYPRWYTYKYPKAGEDNSIVEIRIFDVRTGKIRPADLGPEADQYIPRIKWLNAQSLCVYRLNRHQNKLDFLEVDAGSGGTRLIYTETNPYYIEINDNFRVLDSGSAFIFTSEQDGFNHLFRVDLATGEARQLTRGNWEVAGLIGYHPEAGALYFTAGMDSPLERKLYELRLQDTTIRCLTPAAGVHNITPITGYRFFLDEYSSLNEVPVFRLIDNAGKTVRILEDNQALKRRLGKYALGNCRLLKVPGAEGDSLNAWMITPPGFKPSGQYPVLLYQYSGPGSQEVLNKFAFNNFAWHHMMAQKGYIVLCADGRGTGGRGQEFKKQTYMQLGNLESADQIAVARHMASLPFVDKKRIGIWGWSYGGFISATCIFKGADLFKTAVSVAPVTNWRFYDNIYTERYMRKPEENEAGYDKNAPEKMVDLLEGNLLIVHGVADDNVHFQNAAVLTDALIQANKQFQSEYYPNANHGIYGGKTREQLFRRITNYLLENL